MRVRFSLLSVMMAICCTLALGQNNAASNGSGQAPDATNNAALGSKDRPLRIGSPIQKSIVHKVDPIYPEYAKAIGISGAVVMMALIDGEGKIAKLSVVSGPPILRDAATTAVNQWTYKPFLLKGKPMFLQTMITVNFILAQ